MKKLALFCLLACTTPAAWAQYGEIWFSAGQNFLTNKGLGTLATIGGSQDDVTLTNGFRFGFRIRAPQGQRAKRVIHTTQVHAPQSGALCICKMCHVATL